MIEHFPDPYPDEILYSVFARYSDHVHYTSQMDICLELFGKERVSPVVDLPSYLGYLIKNLPFGHTYTVDTLINDHTLLPLYRPFLLGERLGRIQEHMRVGTGPPPKLGMSHLGDSLSTCLGYCPKCVEHDRINYGECYWHRLHQGPGVEICLVHKIFLEKSKVRAKSDLASKRFISAEQAIDSMALRTAECSPWYGVLTEIATDTRYLLDHFCKPLDPAFFRDQYHALLAQHGFTTAAGLIRSTELLKAFADRYSSELLSLFHCELKAAKGTCTTWLTKLVGSRNLVYPPICHILVMHLLGTTAEMFFRQKFKFAGPFGSGPWPCLNSFCTHYQQDSIQSYELSKCSKKGMIVGKFACSCGFTYSRSTLNRSAGDSHRKSKVLTYGPVWEKKFRELWLDPTLNLKTLSSYLGTNSSRLYKLAKKLDLPVPRTLPASQDGKKTRNCAIKDTSWYRAQWLALIRNTPHASQLTLRRKLPSVYVWLALHDAEWFAAHRPPKRSSLVHDTMQSLVATSHLEHKEITDDMVAEAVRAAAHRIVISSGPPKRVTTNSIQQELANDIPEVGWLRHKSLNKMPLTALALREVTETHEMFAIRRLWWVARQFQKEQRCPSRTELLHRARLYPFLHLPSVQRAIEELMEMLTQFA